MTIIPSDKELYNKIKKIIFHKYPINSAYRSGLLVKKYKEEYLKKYGNNNSYIGNKKNSNLYRWYLEKWQNQNGEIGYKNLGDIYRPTIRVNKKTPITFKELTKKEIKKAMVEKEKNGRVKRFRL